MYLYNKIKPKAFFTNSGAIFNTSLANISINKFYFVELVDYFLLVKILENHLPYIFVETNSIDHYAEQNNISPNSGRKYYPLIRKKEVFISSSLLLFKVLFSHKLRFNQKSKLTSLIIKNLINICFK